MAIQAKKRTYKKRAPKVEHVTEVNTENWIMRFAASPWAISLSAAALVAVVALLLM